MADGVVREEHWVIIPASEIMAVVALLGEHADPADEEIDAGITNICRCGTFARVRSAIHAVAKG